MTHTGCATVAGGGAIDRERSAVAMQRKRRDGPASHGAPALNSTPMQTNGNPKEATGWVGIARTAAAAKQPPVRQTNKCVKKGETTWV